MSHRAARGHALRVLVLCALGACAGGPDSERPSGPVAGAYPVAVEQDAALRAKGQAAIDVIVPAFQRCHAFVDTLPDPADAQSSLPPESAAAREACGEVATLYDRLSVGLIGQSRTLDVLLNDLARLGDDVDFLVRSLDVDRTRARQAVAHMKEAVSTLDARLAGWPTGSVMPYPKQVRPEQWPLDVENDGQDGTGLEGHLDRYAFQQGLDPVQVRRRMIDAFGRMIAAPIAGRAVALDGAVTLSATERTARKAYLEAYGRWLSAYDRVSRRYIAGEIRDEPARAAAIAETAQAYQAWKATWEAERARVGPMR